MSKRLLQTVYKLKRIYGRQSVLYKQGTKTVNIETGAITWEGRSSISLRKTIVLPAKLTREQIQTISMISSNKLFVEGGMFDTASRWFFIDPKDLPVDYEIKRDDWLVYNGAKYEIKDIKLNEFDLLWEILGTELVGATFEEVHNLSGYSILDLQHSNARLKNGI